MDQNNIEKAFVSCAGPGTVLQPNNSAAGIELTQRMNNFTADMKKTYPTRFGYFASLPLPFIDATLVEIDRALDELDADGFVLLSNHYGLYLGDPKLAPVYEKLNQRNAVLFIHPTIPCPRNTPINVEGNARLDYVAPMMNAYPAQTEEFIFDTTRSVSDLILSGTAAAYAQLKWIVPHCGSALPSLIDRFIRISSLAGPKIGSDRKAVPYSVQNATELLQKQFWFDLAGFSMGNQIYNMRRLFGADKFTYGSDVPFTVYPGSLLLTKEMNETLPKLFNDDEISMIFRGNALKMLSGR